jgi:hypothetical protein
VIPADRGFHRATGFIARLERRHHHLGYVVRIKKGSRA